MRRPPSLYTVPVDVYHASVELALTTEAAQRYARKYGATPLFVESYGWPSAGRAGIWTDVDGASRHLVYIGTRGGEAVDTAAHEAVHVAYTILDDKNVPHNEDNNEAMAYLVGYLTERFVGGVRCYEAAMERWHAAREA